MRTKTLADGTTVTTRSNSETGHAKNVASFSELIEALKYLGDKYQPGNEDIQLWSLGRKEEAVAKTMSDFGTALQADKNAENDRTEVFSPLNTYSTRIVGALSSSKGISPLTIKDAQSILTKMRGKRSAKGTKGIEEAKIAGLEAPVTISVSQQSIDQKMVQFNNLKKLVETQPGYMPNETDLKLTAITGYETQLKTSNAAKVSTDSKLSAARTARDVQLYYPETGVVALSKTIKSYVMSVLTASNVTFKKIDAIPFKTVKDKGSKL
jgi:hypothetical protein